MSQSPNYPFTVCRECSSGSGGGGGVSESEMKKYVDEQIGLITTDIEAALDEIIAIQNELIGGESE